MNAEPIKGGYILFSRKLLRSGIMDKPPLYLKLWAWMLMTASFKDHGGLKRGQFFTSLDKMRTAMSHKVGYRLEKPSTKQIRCVTKDLTKARMIVTTKVTHGMVITILNYDYYQDLKNYEGHNEGTHPGHSEGTILRKKGRKKEQPFDFFSLRERYSDQNIIDKSFAAIASTRKTGKVADSILFAQLKKWEKYPAEHIEDCIRIYLEKNYATEGKNEKYLFGIIRKQAPKPRTNQNTGSELLDSYYANRV